MTDHLVKKGLHKYCVTLSAYDNQQVVLEEKIGLFVSDTSGVQFYPVYLNVTRL